MGWIEAGERRERGRECAGGDDAEVREGRGWSTTNIQSDQIVT